jgi:hypothetical protein
MWRSTVIVLVFAGSALTAPAPPPAPSTQPGIAQWFAGLASPDADLREQSRTNLLGLSRSDLPRLRELIEQNQPLAPAQMAALHDIVIQLYLSGEPYQSDGQDGFIGLRWHEADESGLGVSVDQRIPGFSGFQMLRDGDLILGVALRPDGALQLTPAVNVLVETIKNASPRRDIQLEVLRQGQRIRVPMHLRPKPTLSDLTDDGIDSYFAQWQKKGEDYWQQQFLPLLRPGVS